MIIICQDGETVFTLEEPFRAEILPVFNDPSSCFQLFMTEPPKAHYIRYTDNDKSESIGVFKSLNDAKRTLSDFTAAYERGDRAFHIPRDKIKEEVSG